MSNKSIERIFQAVAALLILTAAYYLWDGDHERVFILAALGSLSFFISFRFQVKQRLSEKEEQRRLEESSDPEHGAGMAFDLEKTTAESDKR